MGINESDMHELFCRLDLAWDGQFLCITESVRDGDDIYGTIYEPTLWSFQTLLGEHRPKNAMDFGILSNHSEWKHYYEYGGMHDNNLSHRQK